MNSPRRHIEPERLVDVAIVVLKACTDYAAAHNGHSIHPTELMGEPGQAREFTQCTRFEIEEATMFLVRLGYLEPARKES
jgi:hypothetical protein